MNKNENSVDNYVNKQIEHFAKKAKHNKNESLWCFRLIMVATLVAPLFVTLGETVVFAKIIPSLLSVIAAFCTAWIQLRKPQELWSMYRNAQRAIENQYTKYNFKIDEYTDLLEDDSNKLLIKNVSTISFDTHKQWQNSIPNITDLESCNTIESTQNS